MRWSETLSRIQIHTYLQGVRMQTVTSNLDQTKRKNAINFNLKVGSDQGRLGISFYIVNLIFDFQTMCKMDNFFITKSGIL